MRDITSSIKILHHIYKNKVYRNSQSKVGYICTNSKPYLLFLKNSPYNYFYKLNFMCKVLS